jgi:hypothetical protein
MQKEKDLPNKPRVDLKLEILTPYDVLKPFRFITLVEIVQSFI